MATSFEILQQIRNAVDTSQVGWERYAKAVIPLYKNAYDSHVSTLNQAKTNVARAEEEAWLVFSTILGLTAGFWTPRFLKPVASGFGDDLVKFWVAVPLKQGMKEFAVEVGSELGKEVLSHVSSTLSVNAQAMVSSSSSDKFDAVVEDTVAWGSRLEEGIKDRAYSLKKGLDDIIRQSDKWSVGAAEFLRKSFEKYCPFITDMPADPKEGNFRTDFQRISELTMWSAWGKLRDKKWWKDNPDHRHNDLIGIPVFMKLTSLGVPPSELAEYINSYSGTTVVTYRRPGWEVRMPKFIEWAEKYSPAMAFYQLKSKESEQVCRVMDDKLILKKQQNACYAGQIN